jgi:type I restriction-modification system DNA methylase subunit
MAQPIHTRVACPHLKDFCRALAGIRGARSTRELFADFLESSLLVQHAAVVRATGGDPADLERRYQIVRQRAGDAALDGFTRMYACLVESLEAAPRDAFGELFAALEVGNHDAGQFYTPFPVAQFMARMSLPDPAALLAKSRPITVLEPAVGAGGMLIAVRNHLIDCGLSPHRDCLAVGIDLDARAVAMSYLQTTLLGLPAILLHGNSLTLAVHASYPNLFAQPFVRAGFDGTEMLRRHAGAATSSDDVPRPTPKPDEPKADDPASDEPASDGRGGP